MIVCRRVRFLIAWNTNRQRVQRKVKNMSYSHIKAIDLRQGGLEPQEEKKKISQEGEVDVFILSFKLKFREESQNFVKKVDIIKTKFHE